MKFKSFSFIFFPAIFFICQCGGNPDPDKGASQAKGVVLAFHRQPNEEEKTLILEKLQATGLQKKSENERFKTWVFEWPDWQEGAKAEKICEDLSTLSFLEYCEPDSFLTPGT